MNNSITKKEILKWTEIIFNQDSEIIAAMHAGWKEYRKTLVDKIAEDLYEDIRRSTSLFKAPFPLDRSFRELSSDEKLRWYDIALGIPSRLKSLNLKIRPYSYFCMTCIITEDDIEKLAQADHDKYCKEQRSTGWVYGRIYDTTRKTDPLLVAFANLPEASRRFFLELNYLIPSQLKKAGFEIIRPEAMSGINERMIGKIARAIHSRYMHEMRKQITGKIKKISAKEREKMLVLNDPGLTDFDKLPYEIKFSNIDNAFHIPTKLFSIGYKIRQVRKGHKSFALHLNNKEIETMAAIEHLRWSWDKRLNGWIYGKEKDNVKKIHPGLIPYRMLPETEKEKDRELVRLIPGLLQDIDVEAYPVNPDMIKKLSYAIKPQSSIHRILEETRELNEQIRGMVTIPPEVERMVSIRNKKIEEAINEIEGSYNYAKHIQETFLPDDLFVRECFPDSFVLFKPRDIVSGDFYFFSRHDNLMVFAAADCTGHGIPGALLSIIGYGTLDQAVNEIRLTEPHEILHHLYSKIHRFLRREPDGSGMSDDMDIVLCTLDVRNNILNYSGVRNPLYRISGSEMIEYKAVNSLNGCMEPGECPFTTEKIRLKSGDSVYLCSDGFTDQFGGKDHKKYQSSRFKNFLLSIRSKPMPEQSDLLYEELEQWREANNEDQTDDILVIGIRI